MPKIDWFDDDQPRWERRRRLGRERRGLPLQIHGGRVFGLPEPSFPSSLPSTSARRPLHQIWGPPRRSQPPT
jgi:hypothetical protein